MIQIIGWTILHSLWQIALIASIYLLLKNSWRTSNSLKKYYLAVSALVTTLLSAIFTFGYLFQQSKPFTLPITDSTLAPITSEKATPILPIESNEIVIETTMTMTHYLAIFLPYLVAFWGLGMLYFTVRFFVNLYGVQQLKNLDNELINEEWWAKIRSFKNQLKIEKKVQIFLSKHIKEPITFGHFKPVILLPFSLITGFDTAAVETVILHELAHIKRHDYLVNLGQSIIEIILFYHPLVWWLSKDIRELREHCCDDLVLSLGDNRATYVETLTALQWQKVGGITNRLSLSASGGDAGFTRRIKRMFGVKEKRGSFRQLMGLFGMLLIFAIGGIWAQRTFQKEINKSNFDQVFVVDKNTTFGELDELSETMRALDVFISLCWKRDGEFLSAIEGTYYDAQNNVENFNVTNISETPIQFVFDNGFLSEISAINEANYEETHKESSIQLIDSLSIDDLTTSPIKKEKGQIYWIDENTFSKDAEKMIAELSALKIFDGYSFNQETNSFNGNYLRKGGGFNYIEVADVTKRPIKMVIENGFITKISIKGDAKDGVGFIYNELLEKAFSDNGKFAMPRPEDINLKIDTLTYLVSNEMTKIELYEMIDKIREHSQVRIEIDPLRTKFDAQDKLMAISGKYYYERINMTPVQIFEVAHLDMFQLYLKTHPDIPFEPTYYHKESNEYIHVTDGFSTALQAFAADGFLKFPPFREYKDIKATLLINQFTKERELAAFAKKILPNNIIFSYQNSEFREDGTIVKLKGVFLGDSRIGEPFFVDDLTKYKVRLKVNKGLVYQPEITQQVPKQPLFYKITNWEALSLDSLEYGLENSNDKYQENSLAKLIPPYVAVDDSVRAMNPIYKAGENKMANPIFVNGQLIDKKDLPNFMQNHLQAAVNIEAPKTKKYSKEETNYDWLYWGYQKINLGKALQKNEKGELIWDIPILQISKSDWQHNKNRPFTFQINGKWHRVKKLDKIFLVAKKKDPKSVNFLEGYNDVIQNKESNVYRL